MSARITIDTGRAERILRNAGKRVRKSNWRKIARPAATILRNDMQSGNSLVPKYRGGKYHIFSRKGYTVKIKAGNLRKSIMIIPTSRTKGSKLVWIGPRYQHKDMGSLNEKTIGETVATSDGFYARMVITKTGNDFMKGSIERNRNEVVRRLVHDANAWLKEIVRRSNAVN